MNVVLVHGAWCDGSMWQAVIALLQDDGHRVVAVQLPLTGLADDIAWTRREIAAFDGPVTLVGHSYGGAVISGAAQQNTQVTGLVLVAAYAPDESETIAVLSERGANTRGRGAIRFAEDGWSDLDPDLFREALAADVPEPTTRVLAAVQKPTHGACFSSPSGRGAWHDLPCAYVLSVDDRILDPGLQHWFAERTNATVTELRSSHLSPISHPGDVAAAIGRMLPAGTSSEPI
ncbi:alpha/beta hydrolase [Amycolatopsis sp. A133]|uniref:alpha/beta fold hydrolase n=1 Tax=Amycolatopsis sp. A133 TaxID=3064472 RepID=UPI0027F5ED28|nr:alpha/beta hydrolase [Amycolatopsis sp. A133]MDQ7806935.1 alpha/beta hydrolase [Amycolatopsis sp. A133]